MCCIVHKSQKQVDDLQEQYCTETCEINVLGHCALFLQVQSAVKGWSLDKQWIEVSKSQVKYGVEYKYGAQLQAIT